MGNKRAHGADGTNGDDDCFPDGLFDIPDIHKSISDWNRLSLEVLKLKCMETLHYRVGVLVLIWLLGSSITTILRQSSSQKIAQHM